MNNIPDLKPSSIPASALGFLISLDFELGDQADGNTLRHICLATVCSDHHLVGKTVV